MQVVVGSESFATKAAAEERLRHILYKRFGKVTDPADDAFLRAAILHHQNAVSKIGTGVQHFGVARDTVGRPYFVIRRTDNSIKQFSYRRVFRAQSEQAKLRSKANGAMRMELRPAVLATRKEHGVDSSFHMDHGVDEQAFCKLRDRFLSEQGIPMEGIKTETVFNGSGHGIGLRMADRALAARWFSFHQEHATLRPLTPEANMRQGAGR